MSQVLDYEEYIDKRVEIRYTNKSTYRRKGLVNKCGTAIRTSSGCIGVLIDGDRNEASGYGVYWFKRSDLKILAEEREDKYINMTGFNKVAVVNLLDDYNKKDYGFALYEEEWKLIKGDGDLVIVNARGKDNRILGAIKDIMSVEEYGKCVTAQVVGVVNMDGYNARIEEENRLKELAKKKAAIEKELEEEINKRKSVEYYEEMSKKYSDNPRLAELVAELKGLGA